MDDQEWESFPKVTVPPTHDLASLVDLVLDFHFRQVTILRPPSPMRLNHNMYFDL